MPSFNKFLCIKDINTFTTKLALRNHFKRSANEQKQQKNSENDVREKEGVITVKSKSKMTPLFTQHKNIDVFVNMVTNEVKKIRPRSDKICDNLSEEEKVALEGPRKHNQTEWWGGGEYCYYRQTGL